MLFSLYCLDKPDSTRLRADTRPAHLEYIETFLDRVVVAGPMLSDSESPLGSLLVMEFDTMSDAQAFADGDPYAKAGLFESVTIRPFKKVFGQ